MGKKMREQILLYLFLAERNALDKFVANLNRDNLDQEEDLSLYSAFYWPNTKEGRDYWCSLAVDYRKWAKP